MFCNVAPLQIRPIPWGWENRQTEHGLFVVKHPGKIRMPILMNHFDWDRFIVERPPLAWRTMTEFTRTDIPFGTRNYKSIFTTGTRFVGFEKMMLEQPDLTPIADTFLEWNERLIKIWKDLGRPLEYFMIGDDYAWNGGLIMRPDRWAEWVKPHLVRLVEFGARNGCKVIFHSCGDIHEILEDLVQIGISILNYQPVGRMESFKGQRCYRKMKLWECDPESIDLSSRLYGRRF